MVVEPWPLALTEGIFLKRYKRFFADIELNQNIEVAHVANTGSMKGLLNPGAQALVLPSQDPARKLKWSLKALRAPSGSWVGVDTGVPSKILFQVFKEHPTWIDPDITGLKMEVKITAKTRLDACATLKSNKQLFIELKNVTLAELSENPKDNVALFPDAVTERGQKHLVELQDLVSKGHRAKLIFMVQRQDCYSFKPAEAIDPKYSELLRQAHKNGVELEAWQLLVTATGVQFMNQKLPIHL